jgi:signal transduction histidine kinase
MSRLVKSAAYRVAITYSAAFALAIVLLGLVLYLAFHRELLVQVDDQLHNETLELTGEFQEGGLSQLLEAIGEREGASLSGEIGYALFDKAGKRIAGHMNTERPSPNVRDIVFIDPKEGPDPARASVALLDGGLTLVVAADREPLERVNRLVLSLLIVALAAVIGIGLAGGLILGGYLGRRLKGIAGTAQGIMAGDLTQRIEVSRRDDEFDRLAVTLNAMLDRIGELMSNLRQVSSDLAHDLRTPLARLHTRLETALASDADSAAMRAEIEDSLARTDEILSLFAAILRISEIESGRLKRNFASFEFSALVDDLCESFAPAIEDGGRHLKWDVEPGILYRGDRDLLAQALVNLLENAQKHTPQGTEIAVTLLHEGDRITLTVSDNGPGVPLHELTRITGRFIRLDAARNTPGNGLGLSLVVAIATLHGARLDLRARTGLHVTLSFPAGEVS